MAAGFLPGVEFPALLAGNARTAKPPVMDQNRRLCLIASNNATLRTRRSKRHRMGIVEPAVKVAGVFNHQRDPVSIRPHALVLYGPLVAARNLK
jgi:hypothetical protein